MRNVNLLKSLVSKICIKWIRVNQGVGVPCERTEFPDYDHSTEWRIENRCTRLKWIGLSFACTKGLRYLLWVRKRREKKILTERLGIKGSEELGNFPFKLIKSQLIPLTLFLRLASHHLGQWTYAVVITTSYTAISGGRGTRYNIIAALD